MARLQFAFVLLITVSTLLASGAQEVPALSISPAKVTMLQGETRTFRAVGKDGKIRHNIRWSISPGQAAKLTTDGDEAVVQAVPSANGPDLYDEEECPQGAFVRALTADGREMWRRQYTGAGGLLSSAPMAKPQTDTGQHLDLHRPSICDGVSPGMTKDEVLKVATGQNLTVQKNQRQSDNWEFEEEGSRCAISFDGKSGAVVKKKKTIIID